MKKIIILLLATAHIAIAKKNPAQKTLLTGIHSGQLGFVKSAICQGADVNQPDKLPYYPIMHAAQSGKIQILEELIKDGARTNVSDSCDRTPLMIAVIHNQPASVKILVEKGKSEINAVDQMGKTALMHAINQGNPIIVKYLLDQDAHLPRMIQGQTTENFITDKSQKAKREHNLKRSKDYDAIAKYISQKTKPVEHKNKYRFTKRRNTITAQEKDGQQKDEATTKKDEPKSAMERFYRLRRRSRVSGS